jgi:hypothetical protein
MIEAVSVGDELRELIRQQNWNQLRDRLTDLHPSDVADLIIALPREEEGFVFRVLPRDEAGEVFSYLPPDHQEGLIESLSNEQVRNVLADRCWQQGLLLSFVGNAKIAGCSTACCSGRSQPCRRDAAPHQRGDFGRRTQASPEVGPGDAVALPPRRALDNGKHPRSSAFPIRRR